jgi:hypothetical protein
MVNGNDLLSALALGAALTGCNELAGLREGVFDPCVDSGILPLSEERVS